MSDSKETRTTYVCWYERPERKRFWHKKPAPVLVARTKVELVKGRIDEKP